MCRDLLCGHRFSFLLGRYLGMQLLDHKESVYEKTAKMFSKLAVLFYFCTSNIWMLQFLYIFTNTCYLLIVVLIPLVVQWNLTRVFICVSLMINIEVFMYMIIIHLHIFSVKQSTSIFSPTLIPPSVAPQPPPPHLFPV